MYHPKKNRVLNLDALSFADMQNGDQWKVSDTDERIFQHKHERSLPVRLPHTQAYLILNNAQISTGRVLIERFSFTRGSLHLLGFAAENA